jgi:hypothetical protein
MVKGCFSRERIARGAHKIKGLNRLLNPFIILVELARIELAAS